jgi:hypothetical protein
MKCAFCSKRIAKVPIYDEEEQQELWICFVCDEQMEWHDIRLDQLRATEAVHVHTSERRWLHGITNR